MLGRPVQPPAPRRFNVISAAAQTSSPPSTAFPPQIVVRPPSPGEYDESSTTEPGICDDQQGSSSMKVAGPSSDEAWTQALTCLHSLRRVMGLNKEYLEIDLREADGWYRLFRCLYFCNIHFGAISITRPQRQDLVTVGLDTVSFDDEYPSAEVVRRLSLHIESCLVSLDLHEQGFPYLDFGKWLTRIAHRVE